MESRDEDEQRDLFETNMESMVTNGVEVINNADSCVDFNYTSECNTPKKRKPERPTKALKEALKNSKSAIMLKDFFIKRKEPGEKILENREKLVDDTVTSNSDKTFILESTYEKVLQRVLNQWWEKNVEPDLKKIEGKIKNLESLLLEKEEREYREEAAATALARASDREVSWADEIVNLKKTMQVMSAQLEDLQSNLTKENKRVSKNLTQRIINTSTHVDIVENNRDIISTEENLNNNGQMPDRMSKMELEYEEKE